MLHNLKSNKLYYFLSGLLIVPVFSRFITKIYLIDYISIKSLISFIASFFLVSFIVKSAEGLFSFFSIKFNNSFNFVVFVTLSFGLSLLLALFNIEMNFYYFVIGLLTISNILFFKNVKDMNKKLSQLLNIFVIFFINKFNDYFYYKRVEIAGDVDRWQYPNTSKIFEDNLINVFANPIDDLGYWYINLLVLANFYFAFISKIILLNFEFVPMQIVPSTLIVLFIMFIKNVDIKINTKYLILFLNFFVLLINDWVRYLLINSYMQEGVVSLFFVIIFYNFSRINNLNNFEKKLLYLSIGFFVFSKLFIGLFIFLLPSLFSKHKSCINFIKEYWSLYIGLFSLIGILIRYPKSNVNEFPLTIDFSNISKIFIYWFEDSLFMYIILISSLILIFYFVENKFNIPSFQGNLLFLSILNFLIIMVLYSTLWSTGEEYESSYRYYLQVYYLNLLLIGTMIDKYLVKK